MAFGELPEIPVGTSFISRRALFDRGVHRQLQAGIAGGEHAGTEIDCRLWRLRGRRRLRQRWPHEEPCRRASSSRSPRRASRLRFRAGAERRPRGTPVTRAYSRGARAAASGVSMWSGAITFRLPPPRRLAVPAHPSATVTAASTAAASEPRRMARHQSRNVVKSSRRRCPTCLPPSISVLSSLAFSSAETMFSGSFGSGFVCVGLFVSTSARITRARASPSMNSLACSGRLVTRSRIRLIVAIGRTTTTAP